MKKYADVIAAMIVLGAAPLLLPGGNYYLRLATLSLIYMCWGIGFNLIFGHTRQLFLCLSALAGGGAYAAAILVLNFSLSPGVAIAASTLCMGVVGALFSYIAIRRGLGVIFVGITTLAFGIIFHNLVLGLREWTNGETGLITRIDGMSIFRNPLASYYVFLAVLLLVLALYCALMQSRVGLASRAISDDELTASLSGVDVTGYKTLVAFVGSGIVGFVGALYGFYNGIISPSVFSFVGVDIAVLILLFLGGIGTRVGPLVGGALFVAIEEVVRPFGQLNVFVYGLLLLALFTFFNQGLVPVIGRTLRRLERSFGRHPFSVRRTSLKVSDG